MTELEMLSVRRPARVKLTVKEDCPKCEARGIVVHSTYSEYSGSLEVRVKLCSCVKAELVGKLCLPKRTLDAAMIAVAETA